MLVSWMLDEKETESCSTSIFDRLALQYTRNRCETT